MKIKKKDFRQFDSIIENKSLEKLIGGFSLTFSVYNNETIAPGEEASNNCLGGNCQKHCGINPADSPNGSNTGCNSGCK